MIYKFDNEETTFIANSDDETGLNQTFHQYNDRVSATKKICQKS